MESKKMTTAEAKEINLVDYLSSLGHHAQKISGDDHWYISPLRDEKTPSFKLNSKLNLWFDFGIGKGGTIIDLGIMYFHCDLATFLRKLESQYRTNFFSFQQEKKENKEPRKIMKPKIKVKEISEIRSSHLMSYIESRCIKFDIARSFLEEVMIELGGKEYPLLGFGNNSGGYELRGTGDFKSSIPPKDFTTFKTGNNSLAVVEGMFDFLSHEDMAKKIVPELTDWLVLNSLSFLGKSQKFMGGYERVYLMLDNDKAGMNATEQMLTSSNKFIDLSPHYQNYKDLNDMLVKEKKLQQTLKARQKQTRNRGMHF